MSALTPSQREAIARRAEEKYIVTNIRSPLSAALDEQAERQRQAFITGAEAYAEALAKAMEWMAHKTHCKFGTIWPDTNGNTVYGQCTCGLQAHLDKIKELIPPQT